MKRIIFYIATFIIILSGSYNITKGQIANISASLNKDTVWIGDTLRLTLKVKGIDTHKVNVMFPTFQDTITSSIHIISQDSTIDTISMPNHSVALKKQYIIAAYDSGNVIIPPLPFIFKIDTVQDTVYSSVNTLFVKLIPTDTLKVPLKDVKKPINTPFTFQEFIDLYGIYTLLALLIIILIYIAYRYYSRKKEGKSFIEIHKPTDPPHIVAMRELEALRNKKLWQQNRIKQYYIELTDILRKYMDNRFDLSTMESTSSEIINALKTINLDNSLIEEMRQVFNLADLAKFAKYKPVPEENDYVLKKAIDFVEATKPVEKQEEETNNNSNADTENTNITSNNNNEEETNKKED